MSEKLRKLRQTKDSSISSYSINHNPFAKSTKTQDCVIFSRKKNYSPDSVEQLSKELRNKDIELQQCIEEIAKCEENYQQELNQIDEEYEQ